MTMVGMDTPLSGCVFCVCARGLWRTRSSQSKGSLSVASSRQAILATVYQNWRPTRNRRRTLSYLFRKAILLMICVPFWVPVRYVHFCRFGFHFGTLFGHFDSMLTYWRFICFVNGKPDAQSTLASMHHCSSNIYSSTICLNTVCRSTIYLSIIYLSTICLSTICFSTCSLSTNRLGTMCSSTVCK